VTALDTITCADYRDLLASLPDGSVDAVISDFPYGTTAAKWDIAPDLPVLWDAIKRILKPAGVVVTTASQPFTSMLVMSNLKWFRYEWIWDKVLPSGFLNAKLMPMKVHENIAVFCETQSHYSPQMEMRLSRRIDKRKGKKYGGDGNSSYGVRYALDGEYDDRYPKTIVAVSNANQADKVHPNQKPVALYEYLILTYTKSGDLVCDPFAGSGTTLVAARNTGRHWIGGDTDAGYVAIAEKRLAQPFTAPMFP